MIRVWVFVFFEETLVANGTSRIRRRRGYCYINGTVALVAEERLIGYADGVSAAAAGDVPVGRHVSPLRIVLYGTEEPERKTKCVLKEVF